MKMKKTIVFAMIILSLLLIAAGAYAYDRAAAADAYAARLRETYDGALLVSLARIEDMQVKLQKALVAGSREDGVRYLTAVLSGAESVRQNLSLLPLSHEATQKAVKFANQLGDYAETLVADAQTGFTETDYAALDGMIAACGQLREAIDAARGDIAAFAVSGGSAYWLSGGEAAESGGGLGDGDVSYPTLIYDGPFSDGLAAGEPKALGEQFVTREEAETLARGYVGAARVTGLSAGADAGGAIPAYGVTVQAGDVTLELAISKTGGKLLWMSPDTAGFEARAGIEECRAAAEKYLNRIGFGDVRACSFQVYDGVAVINFAAVQGGVTLYPDLVKTQLRMDTAEVVGVEATRYLTNHAPRAGLVAASSEADARAALSDKLTVDAARLCVIPLGASEAFCYEFTCRYKSDTFLVYIDAATGAQRELLKIVENGGGILTV